MNRRELLVRLSNLMLEKNAVERKINCSYCENEELYKSFKILDNIKKEIGLIKFKLRMETINAKNNNTDNAKNEEK